MCISCFGTGFPQFCLHFLRFSESWKIGKRERKKCFLFLHNICLSVMMTEATESPMGIYLLSFLDHLYYHRVPPTSAAGMFSPHTTRGFDGRCLPRGGCICTPTDVRSSAANHSLPKEVWISWPRWNLVSGTSFDALLLLKMYTRITRSGKLGQRVSPVRYRSELRAGVDQGCLCILGGSYLRGSGSGSLYVQKDYRVGCTGTSSNTIYLVR